MSLLLVAIVALAPVAALVWLAATRPDPHHQFAKTLVQAVLMDGDAGADGHGPTTIAAPRTKLRENVASHPGPRQRTA